MNTEESTAERKRRLEGILLEMLQDVDPEDLPKIKSEFLAEVRRRKFRSINGGRARKDT